MRTRSRGVYGKIGPLIAAATSALDPIEERAKAFGDVLVRVVGPAMDWVTNLLTRMGGGCHPRRLRGSGTSPG
ncbi:hypothetical protein JM654_03845 [Microbacterium oxydans]|nr:hypothetical protein [Microbacterium oxydans]